MKVVGQLFEAKKSVLLLTGARITADSIWRKDAGAQFEENMGVYYAATANGRSALSQTNGCSRRGVAPPAGLGPRLVLSEGAAKVLLVGCGESIANQKKCSDYLRAVGWEGA